VERITDYSDMAEEKKKSTRGAKGKYEELHETIIELHQTTDLNITQICKTAGLGLTQYFQWLKKKPQFAKAIKDAQQDRLTLLASIAQEETINRIKGYTVDEEQVVMKPDADGRAQVTERKVQKRHVKASDTLLMYVNNNRNPENWKHKEHIEHSGEVERTDLSGMSTAELKEYIELRRKAAEA
jgi:hypothetical protein